MLSMSLVACLTIANPADVPVPEGTDSIRIGDFVADVGEVGEAMIYLKSCKDSGGCYSPVTKTNVSKSLLWAALLAAIFKLLLSLLKATTGIWQSAIGKDYTRLATLALGALVFGLTHYAGGHGFQDSLLLSLSGPGAIVIHEFTKIFSNKKLEEPGS